jgi:hypothetical protein
MIPERRHCPRGPVEVPYYSSAPPPAALFECRPHDPAVAQLAGLLASGWSDADVLTAVLASPGLYAAAGGAPAPYVALLYRALLGRAPDPDGLAYFSQEIAGGLSPAFVTRQILATPEGRATRMARLYADGLGWPQGLAALKAYPAVTYWAGLLGGG